jgi:hypothetical protein
LPAVGGLPESEALDAVDAVGAAVVVVAAGAAALWTGPLVGSAGPFAPAGALAVEAALDCTWMRLLASGRSTGDAVGVAGSARVSDRSGGRTDASGGTTARLLVGGSAAIGATGAGAARAAAAAGETALAEGPAGAAAAAGVAEGDHDPPASDAGTSTARRWTGRCTSGLWDVRAATGWTGASTSPAGARELTSWPRGWRIGGSGRTPGTPSRNRALGAMSGASPTARWIGGSDRQAEFGRAGVSVPPAGAGGSVSSRDSGDAVERPKGHGRRTLTPPQIGAC